jgi:hypothetical protein
MKESARMKLWENCLDKSLFRKELENILATTTSHDLFDVLKYCFDKYSDMHADVLQEVFSNCIKNKSKEFNKPVGMWN